MAQTTSYPTRPRLLILGAGWAGFTLANEVDKNRWDVTVCSSSPFFSFTPGLGAAAAGSLDFRCVSEPLRHLRRTATVHQATAESIDFYYRTVTLRPTTGAPLFFSKHPRNKSHKGTFTLSYDALVIAVGCGIQTLGLPGVDEHALFLKDVHDAKRIRERLLEMFEQASSPLIFSDFERRRLLHIAMVGRGAINIEVASKLRNMITQDLGRLYPTLRGLAHITIYEAATKVSGSFDDSLAVHALDKFKGVGVDIRTDRHVEEVGDGWVSVKGEGRVDCGMVLWNVGPAPNELIKGLRGVKQDKRTKNFLVTSRLQVQTAYLHPIPNTYAIGDLSTVIDRSYPAAAQTAEQMAHYLAQQLNLQAIEEDPLMATGKVKAFEKEFVFKGKGGMNYMRKGGLAYEQVDAKAAQAEWVLWKEARYSNPLTWQRWTMAIVFWLLTWVFGRDLSRF